MPRISKGIIEDFADHMGYEIAQEVVETKYARFPIRTKDDGFVWRRNVCRIRSFKEVYTGPDHQERLSDLLKQRTSTYFHLTEDETLVKILAGEIKSI